MPALKAMHAGQAEHYALDTLDTFNPGTLRWTYTSINRGALGECDPPTPLSTQKFYGALGECDPPTP